MKTNVAQTSIESIHQHRESGKSITQKQIIIDCFKQFNNPILTRREISNLTKIELGAVSGRVNSLIKDGVLTECGTITDRKTGKTVNALKMS